MPGVKGGTERELYENFLYAHVGFTEEEAKGAGKGFSNLIKLSDSSHLPGPRRVVDDTKCKIVCLIYSHFSRCRSRAAGQSTLVKSEER